jgi:hypothetical protein
MLLFELREGVNLRSTFISFVIANKQSPLSKSGAFELGDQFI